MMSWVSFNSGDRYDKGTYKHAFLVENGYNVSSTSLGSVPSLSVIEIRRVDQFDFLRAQVFV